MANNYVTIDGEQYDYKYGSYKESPVKAQSVGTGLSKKTLVQTFDFVDTTYDMTLMVKITEARVGYGALSDLTTTHSTGGTCGYTDPFGTAGTVNFLSDIPQQHRFSMADATFIIDIPVTLRKWQP